MVNKPQKPNTKAKSTKHNVSKQQLAIIVLSGAVFILTITTIIGAYTMSYIWRAQQTESNGKITTLISLAVDGLSSPAPVDAQTGKVYIPQSRLVLPMKPDTMGSDISYQYSAAFEGNPEELRIVNTYGLMSARIAMIGAQSMEATFKEVPRLQACARGYLITFKPVTDIDPLTFSKKLADGRMLYAYLDSGCKQDSEDFDNYLKQIDSY